MDVLRAGHRRPQCRGLASQVTSTLPIVCALVPSFKVAIARSAEPALRERPVLIADRIQRGHVIECDAVAFEFGARIGMTLVQAHACLSPAGGAALVVDDPVRNHEWWERALDALDAASPLVEDAHEGTAFVEMRGIAGTPEHWLDTIQAALADTGLPFVVALASNPFVARAAALVYGHSKQHPAIVAAGTERAFLAPLPLRILDLGETTVQRLGLLGLHSLGDIAALPHGPFVRRFGIAAARWHAQARGSDDRPLIPRPRTLRIDRALYGEGTAEREDQLLFALRSLVARVADDIAFAGKRCGLLRLGLECDDATTHEVIVTLAQPSAQSTTLFDLIRARLEGLRLQAPVVGLRLGADRLDEDGTELSLFASNDPDPEVVAIVLARLEAALGARSALRAQLSDGNRFESRFRYDPFTTDTLGAPVAHRPPLPTCTLGFRLVTPREIDVRLQHGMPALVEGCEVREYTGPWRVNETWWSTPLVREEYDVLLADSALYRITREGTQWHLRGMYD